MPGVEKNTLKDTELPVSTNLALIDRRVHELLVESSGKLQVGVRQGLCCLPPPPPLPSCVGGRPPLAARDCLLG